MNPWDETKRQIDAILASADAAPAADDQAPALTRADRDFLAELSRCSRPSPQQLAVLDRIALKLRSRGRWGARSSRPME